MNTRSKYSRTQSVRASKENAIAKTMEKSARSMTVMHPTRSMWKDTPQSQSQRASREPSAGEKGEAKTSVV